jgi:hypothetical protein
MASVHALHSVAVSHGIAQPLDAAMARALHAVAWVVMWDLPAHPNRYAARLVTSGQAPSPYLLLADTLADIQELLPPGLVRSQRMPVDPPEVVEIWFAG